MESIGLSFNANDHRVSAPARAFAVPLVPPAKPIEIPSASLASILPAVDQPAPLQPSFKDIYLQKRAQLQKSAEGMEGILVRQVLKAMRSTIPEPQDEDEDLFGSSSHASQMFKQMMDDQLSDVIAGHGDFGIADRVFKSTINTVTQEFTDQLASGATHAYGLPMGSASRRFDHRG